VHKDYFDVSTANRDVQSEVLVLNKCAIDAEVLLFLPHTPKPIQFINWIFNPVSFPLGNSREIVELIPICAKEDLTFGSEKALGWVTRCNFTSQF
jgi:hypothetical protein